jgi:hypothetical protein
MVRLLPPLLPDLARYHIAFTTPYILMASKDNWLQFLKRGLSQSGFGTDKEGCIGSSNTAPTRNTGTSSSSRAITIIRAMRYSWQGYQT